MKLSGQALRAANKAAREGRLFYRCSDGAGRSCNGGYGVVLPASQGIPGPWTKWVSNPVLCFNGWHATSDPLRWAGSRLALVEVNEVVYRGENKIVCHSLRELCVVDEAIDVRIWVAAHRPFLHGVDLRGADLRWADLRCADLRGANLHGASLEGANLRGADLRWASLCGVDLRGANLEWVDLNNTILGKKS